MKNLKEYGVVSLQEQDVQQVYGGLTGLEVMGGIAAAYTVGKIIDNWSESFMKGWNNPI